MFRKKLQTIHTSTHIDILKKLAISGSCILTFMLITPTHAYACNVPKSYYKNVLCTSDSRYYIANKDNGSPVAILDSKGKKTTDLFKYDRVLPNKLESGLLPVYKNGKVGYINYKGVVAIPLIYDSFGGSEWARPANNSRVIVKKAGKFGVVNTSNKVIVPFSTTIDTITDYNNGNATMIKSGKEYRLNTRGDAKIVQDRPTSRPQIHHSFPPHAMPRQSMKVQSNRPPVAQPIPQPVRQPRPVPTGIQSNSLDQLNKVIDDFGKVDKNQKANNKSTKQTQTNKPVTASKSIKNKTTKQATKKANKPTNKRTKNVKTKTQPKQRPKQNKPKRPIIREIVSQRRQRDEVILFPHNNEMGKWGFVDENGVSMITYSFDEVNAFAEGLAGVRIGNKWGFLDVGGDLIIDFNFDESQVDRKQQVYNDVSAFKFINGKAWVGNRELGEKICIDKTGKFVDCY